MRTEFYIFPRLNRRWKTWNDDRAKGRRVSSSPHPVWQVNILEIRILVFFPHFLFSCFAYTRMVIINQHNHRDSGISCYLFFRTLCMSLCFRPFTYCFRFQWKSFIVFTNFFENNNTFVWMCMNYSLLPLVSHHSRLKHSMAHQSSTISLKRTRHLGSCPDKSFCNVRLQTCVSNNK